MDLLSALSSSAAADRLRRTLCRIPGGIHLPGGNMISTKAAGRSGGFFASKFHKLPGEITK
jgi:hypothetical protein